MSVDASRSPVVVLTHANPADEVGIRAAIELGNQFNATLGFLPAASYAQAAADGTLLLASVDEDVVGYALYGLARGRVRLSHLCVATEWRRSGIARQMVDHISDRHRDSRGIQVRCRLDYKLSELWIRLRFSRRSEQPGRAKAGSILVNWWRDHDHPNLFTRLDDTTLVRASIDLNILRDLTDPHARGEPRDVQALVDDQIADRLELIRTGSLDAEIGTIEGELRSRCTERAEQVLTAVHPDSASCDAARAALVAAAAASLPGYPRTRSEEFDLRHVADAIGAGVSVFITRDEELIRTLGAAAEQHGLRLLKPVEVVTHLDELVRAAEYRPAALLDTNLSRQLLGTARESALAGMVNAAAGERVRDFTKLIQALAVERRDRVGIFAPNGDLLAAYCAIVENRILRVALARIADHPLRDTLARQLLFSWRQTARSTGALAIRITDQYLSPPMRLAAFQEGFAQTGDDLSGYTLNVCGDASEVALNAGEAARLLGYAEPTPLRSGMPAAAAAELERVWWPAKIADSQVSTYLIPIRQVFSTDLLGVPPSILPRVAALGISREHVYFRTPHGTPAAPARLLWYMSQGGTQVPQPGAVIACSQVNEVVEGSPDDMYRRFRHLGVWDAHQVHAAARDGVVQALVFSDTEIFARPVGLQRLRALAAIHGGVSAPQQPTRIDQRHFADIYREGTTP